MSEQSPEQFGRYQLNRLLAEGGMAEIFLAELTSVEGFSKCVALKRTLPHLSRQPEFVSMFLDEARLASRLSHPNVVQVFDFGEIDSRYYIAMEYLAGEDLGRVIRQAFGSGRPLPLPVALQIMIGACDGLHYAHEYSERGRPLNLVHRDISPSNIMVTFQGGVKVVDFGIARALGRRQEATATGVVKGKFPYCSPEQLLSNDFDRRSDIFALGVVFHELLTGQRLFKRPTELLTCQAVLGEEAPPVSSIRRDLPAALDRVIARALAKSADERYQTCLTLRRDLEGLLSGPPARLDEYMVGLFGEKHVSERTNVGSDSRKVPTAADSSMQSGNAGPLTVPQALEARPARGEEAETAAGVLPAAVEPGRPPEGGHAEAVPAPPLDLALPVVEAPRQRRRTALPAGAGVLVLLLALGGGLAGLWRQPVVGSPLPVDAPVTPPPPATASLSIDTLPTGATVEVAGKPRPGVTPLRLEGLAPGEVELSLSLAGYQPLKHTARLAAGQQAATVLQLVKQETWLDVQAPESARLILDGVDRGQVRRLEVGAGEHQVRVVAPGHQPYETTVTVAAGGTTAVAAKLVALRKSAPGKLDVSCVPWCRVFIDGKDVGRTSPIVGLELPSGQRRLRLEHPPSGRSRETLLEVRPGQTVRESAQFR